MKHKPELAIATHSITNPFWDKSPPRLPRMDAKYDSHWEFTIRYMAKAFHRGTGMHARGIILITCCCGIIEHLQEWIQMYALTAGCGCSIGIVASDMIHGHYVLSLDNIENICSKQNKRLQMPQHVYSSVSENAPKCSAAVSGNM